MKSLIILFFALTAALTISAQNGNDTMPENKSSTTMKEKFTCPMHPDIVMDAPGKCPKCGMNLIPSKTDKMKMDVMKTYACPMHPDEVSDKPGTCSKCGMKLVEKKSNKRGKTDLPKG